MAQQARTRTQRRMDKKQAILLLVVLLVASLVSFSLGVMVGKRQANQGVVETVMSPVPVRAVPPVAYPTGTAPNRKPVDSTQPGELTFYDTLPKGSQALGSGINMPPKQASETAEQVTESTSTVVPPAPKEATAPRPEIKTEKVAKLPPVESTPQATSSGDYVVQVASFQKAEAAIEMSTRLSGKGYSAFVQQADLGAKGIWHRVYCGPYADRDAAGKVIVRLRDKEKLNGLVKKI
ncbi:MAG: hypothetical protein C0616_10015 [Desulfuromonas sp.]|nr:MAG: hypothetical protein C0616_10015 [Desulfuromonas sp.]